MLGLLLGLGEPAGFILLCSQASPGSVTAPAPILLSGFYLSWRASSTRNAILLPVLGSLLGPLLGTLLSGGTAKLSVDQAFSGRYLPNMSTHIILNGSPSKGRDVVLTLRGRRPQPASSKSLQYSVEAHVNTGMQCSSWKEHKNENKKKKRSLDGFSGRGFSVDVDLGARMPGFRSLITLSKSFNLSWPQSP